MPERERTDAERTAELKGLQIIYRALCHAAAVMPEDCDTARAFAPLTRDVGWTIAHNSKELRHLEDGEA
jgi:hypothetical protein